MVADPAKRKIFIDSILAFIKSYKFDGVDLDWEYPMNSSDKAGFSEFFNELRTTLGKDYIISVAVPVNQTVIDLGILQNCTILSKILITHQHLSRFKKVTISQLLTKTSITSI